MIHSFCDTHPELSFSLKEVEDEELLSGLEKDFFNLIFVRKHMIDPELYTFMLSQKTVWLLFFLKLILLRPKIGLSF